MKSALKVKLKPLVKGALTFIPGMAQLFPESGGATLSASYCYGVWIKHLVMLWENGMRSIPRMAAELGPGSSLGTGLAAMLCGVDHYRALDVVKHSRVADNLRVLDDLVELFRNRSPRPQKGWPDFDQYLDQTLFPGHILTDDLLRKSMAPERIAKIRRAITHPEESDSADITIKYIAPWDAEHTIEKDSVDLIVSHAVLGEVVDLENTYQALNSWLKPGGVMSHQIGMTFKGINGKWNGYWACPEPMWKIIKGRRPFIVNRQPVSVHLELLKRQKLELLCKIKAVELGVDRSHLSRAWKNLSDNDFLCSTLFVQARKPAASTPADSGGPR